MQLTSYELDFFLPQVTDYSIQTPLSISIHQHMTCGYMYIHVMYTCTLLYMLTDGGLWCDDPGSLGSLPHGLVGVWVGVVHPAVPSPVLQPHLLMLHTGSLGQV